MKERPIPIPILFSGPMVRAILDGSKTQTRRIVKPQPPDAASIPLICDDGSYYEDWRGTRRHVNSPKCPFWRGEGTILWVRETWQAWVDEGEDVYPWGFSIADAKGNTKIEYAATSESTGPWRPSIYMPRWASRINLLVTGVRVERLNEISEDDARAEGIKSMRGGFVNYQFETAHPKRSITVTDRQHRIKGFMSARNSFRSLWDSINGAGSWDANPWVWVVEFTREEGAQ